MSIFFAHIARVSRTRITIAKIIRQASIVSAMLTVVACGGDSGTQPVVIPKGFGVTLSSTTLNVTAGSSGSITATISRTGNLDATINLSTEGVPSGITATFSPASITASTTSTTLTVVAASTVAAGAYTFTIRGSTTGVADQTATATVTVAAQPAFNLSVAPTSLTIQAGSNAKSIAQASRINFADAITLTVEGAPAGVTTAFLTPTLVADTTSLTVTVAANTTPGTYTLLVRARSSLADRTTPLSVVVTPPPDFTFVAAPTTLSVQQGQTSSASTLTIARSGGFAGAVALTATGLPSGITANFATTNVAGASTTVTFTATLGATVGNANVIVHANAPGIAERTATIALTVTAFPGSFSLTLSSGTLSIAQGANGAATITIARTAPFTGAIALSVTGAPPGVTTTLGSATIAAGSTTTSLTVAAAILATPITASLVVHATGAGVPDQSVPLSLTVTAAPIALISQHVLAQEGLAIALASTVLQTQIQVLFAVTVRGEGSATDCTQLQGGGSVQSLPIGANDPTKLAVYYDAACTKPYMIGDATSIVIQSNHQIDITETANYFSLTGAPLGVLSIQESAQIADGVQDFVSGLGTFTPANGATPVKLGLTCLLPSNSSANLPCQGGIQQNVPSLNRAIGSVTPLTLHVNDVDSPITFEGVGSTLTTGALNSLTLSAPTPGTLLVSGGSLWGSSTQQGGAGNFALFPPTPTGWTVTDTAHDMKFAIDVVSNVVRNSVGTIKLISTGATLATIAVDQSGTGTVTWSDGSTAAITGWLFAN